MRPFIAICYHAITHFLRTWGNLNRAATNRALAPIGKRLPEGVVGNDAVQFVKKTLGNAYKDVLPHMKVRLDAPFDDALKEILEKVDKGVINPNAAKYFKRTLAEGVAPAFREMPITGESFMNLKNLLTEQSRLLSASTDADERLLGQAYRELGDQLNKLSVRSNPDLGDELAAINRGWANFKRVQKAASSVAAEDGVFSPAQLHSAVKAADRSKDKARFAEGNALMQDLSAAGKNILNNRVPNSGTADRLLMGGGALASYLVNPLLPLGLLAGSAAYSPWGQALGRGLVSSRPIAAQGAANALRQAAPALGLGGANVGLSLIERLDPDWQR